MYLQYKASNDSLHYCQQEKGWEVLLVHYDQSCSFDFQKYRKAMPIIDSDFKRFTSKSIVRAIKENPQESRNEFLVDQLLKAGSQSSNVKTYQFWRHDNKPIELWSNKVIDEKLNYVYNNPVEEGIFFRAEDYLYSSATDYAGEKGLLNNVIVIE